MRTQQAVRQVVFATLTSPQLTYTVNTGSPQTLPVANVKPQAVWLTGGDQAPMPLVAFQVNARGVPTRTLPDRMLSLKVWCVSANGPDECTELYEAVRARLHTADQSGATDMSRVASGSTLAVAIRECIEERVSDADFDNTTQRWYLVADYRIAAV